jgi:hypothetical protein
MRSKWEGEVMRSGVGVWPRVMKRERGSVMALLKRERSREESRGEREKMGRKGTWAQ